MSDTTAEAPAAPAGTAPVRGGGPESITDRLRSPRTYAVLIGSLLLLVLPFYLD
ncbi:branched-chain amino acid ABC transporter permease, partial [Streptomyces sp. SID7982]|nr:branched-chain amino acid ABC transporter permease [Streptomyces sp. SID7982]